VTFRILKLLILDDTEVVIKPVNCFDTNVNDRLICAGTDEINNDVYLLFFDIRERRLMGGFFESHQEEIVDVKFHPENPDLLASGSTDGLINVFDCKQQSEDDALQYSLNTCDSVQKIKWHSADRLSCITNTNDLHLYDTANQDLLKKWERKEITEAMKRKSVIDCNIIDCYNIGSEMMFFGTSNYNKGECIRSMKFNQDALTPLVNFAGNSQIIRSSLFDEQKNIYLTFGENANITVWKEGSSNLEESSTRSMKEESSVKKKIKKKSNPY
jgi:WD40 repeat protein